MILTLVKTTYNLGEVDIKIPSDGEIIGELRKTLFCRIVIILKVLLHLNLSIRCGAVKS